MNIRKNIFLVGLMGTGKTTIGRLLAKKLNKRFVDSDSVIEKRAGISIPMIFQIEGEKSFRRREIDIISEVTIQKNIVLATGGGAILHAGTRAILKERGIIIYLHANINQLLYRTNHDKNRPLLQTINPRMKLMELSQQRDLYYREIANLTIETGRFNVQYLVEIIMSQLSLEIY